MKAQTARTLRKLHLYLGLFFAPAILFFAFSGMLQTFGFHEEKGGHGVPPNWIVAISDIHKESRLSDHKPPAPAGQRAPAKPIRPAPPPGALKIFIGLMAIGLMASALLGIVIATTTRATRRGATIALAAGIVLPIVLLLA